MSQSTQLQIFSKAADIAVASPQVVAHRVARMALAGPVLNDRDRKEFTGMVQEKQLAFAQSFVAWNTEILRWQMRHGQRQLAKHGQPHAVTPAADGCG